MDKLDFKTADKPLYSGRRGRWDRVTVPPMTYLAVEGEGAPEGPAFAAALGALYPVAYGVKFAMKAQGRDFAVPPLSALWWADDPAVFSRNDRAAWRWRALIRVPEEVSEAMLAAAREKAATKADPAALERLALWSCEEGDAFQTLHVGPYSEEGPILAELHEKVMPEAGVTFGAPHHEIYLSDARRTAPEKLRTILRQPVVPV